jgi:hypothetical protein
MTSFSDLVNGLQTDTRLKCHITDHLLGSLTSFCPSNRHGMATSSSMRPFIKTPPAVTEWLGQYDRPEENMLFRYKPLVLDGGPSFGKTSWALSFFGADSTLQVNCQNITAPNLLSWRRQCDKYSAILFDEGSWKLIFENKMLFRAGPASVDLGQSATNCNTYKVFVFAVPMIICSNQFWKDIDDAGRQYLASNIIYLPVTSPCYT